MFPLRALRDPMPNLRFGTIKSVPRSGTQASVGLKAPQLIPVCSQGWRSLLQSPTNTQNQVTQRWTRTSLAPRGGAGGVVVVEQGHRTAGFPAAQENTSSGALPDYPMGENGLFQNFCICLIGLYPPAWENTNVHIGNWPTKLQLSIASFHS